MIIYLPRLVAMTAVALFDEEGKSPERASLFRDERVPVTRVVLSERRVQRAQMDTESFLEGLEPNEPITER